MIDLEKAASISYSDLQTWIADNALSDGTLEDTRDLLIYLGYFYFVQLQNSRSTLTLDDLDRSLFGDADIDDLAPVTGISKKLN